jgi:hypothetical protein
VATGLLPRRLSRSAHLRHPPCIPGNYDAAVRRLASGPTHRPDGRNDRCRSAGSRTELMSHGRLALALGAPAWRCRDGSAIDLSQFPPREMLSRLPDSIPAAENAIYCRGKLLRSARNQKLFFLVFLFLWLVLIWKCWQMMGDALMAIDTG